MPNGINPAGLEFAPSRAHCVSITRSDDGAQRVSIACEEQDRTRLLEYVAVGEAN